MRKLTISRTKSFVACLMSVNIYIEDASLRPMSAARVFDSVSSYELTPRVPRMMPFLSN